MRRVRTECLRVDETWETEKRWRGRVKALVQDLRFGARMLAKSRGFTAVAVLSLALGIGLNTAVFSVVDAMVFRPLPYGDPDRLVVLTLTDRQTADTWSYPQVPQYLSWKRHADVFEEIASPVETRRFDVASEGRPTERLQGARVSPNLFTTLGVEPLLGRDFLPDDEALGSEEVVILSHGLWRRRFGADPSVIGETLWLDRNPATIVGVLPSGSSPAMGVTPQFWVPARLTPADDQTFVVVTARLAPGVTLEQAQAAMDTVVAQHADAVPAAREGWGVRLVPLHEHFTRNLRHTLFTLWGAVGFVLLIACANVAGVLLARASARTQEVATRLALGASRWRVARLFLVEGVLLALVGGALGALLAYGGLHLIRLLNPDANPFISIFPRLNDASLNGRVLGYTLLVSLLTALLFSVAPALTGSTPDRTGSRKDAGRGAMAGAERLRLRSALVVAQIALALVLLSGAGLLVNTMRYLAQVDPGFDAERLLTFRLELAEARYLQDAAIAGEPQTLLSPRLDAFHARVLRRLETLSGVESAAAIDILPLSHTGAKRILAIDGYPAPAPGEEIRREDVDEWVRPTYRAVGGGLFRRHGHPALTGARVHRPGCGRGPVGRRHQPGHGRDILAGQESDRQAADGGARRVGWARTGARGSSRCGGFPMGRSRRNPEAYRSRVSSPCSTAKGRLCAWWASPAISLSRCSHRMGRARPSSKTAKSGWSISPTTPASSSRTGSHSRRPGQRTAARSRSFPSAMTTVVCTASRPTDRALKNWCTGTRSARSWI